MTEDLKHTSLYETHTSLGGRIVPFAGWGMPLQYTGILAEARAVRSKAGLFDVSHMGRLYISGTEAPLLMDWILTADASRLRTGRAHYGMVCNEEGGIIDDTVFYRLEEDRYLLVCNASNRRHVVPWLQRWVEEKFSGVSIEDQTEATAMIALQGPAAQEMLGRLCDSPLDALRPFAALDATVSSRNALIGRTGYTGEDGFELITQGEDAQPVWKALRDLGAVPCGLGARDVLRLEAALPLHGQDIDASTTPLEAGLDRFVRLEKDFIGAGALRRQNEAGPESRLVGLEVHARSIARPDCEIFDGDLKVGKVTSGTYSPTLDRSIAMGYVSTASNRPGTRLFVDIRGRRTEMEVVPLPFYTRAAVP